jgi:hypothetical protein
VQILAQFEAINPIFDVGGLDKTPYTAFCGAQIRILGGFEDLIKRNLYVPQSLLVHKSFLSRPPLCCG